MTTTRLNLGCGPVLLAGHLNLDVEQVAPDGEAFRRCDVRHGLPWPHGSVEAINASHFLEHLTLGQARALLSECHRVLAPGGVLRVAVPDLRLLTLRYLRGDMGGFAAIQPPEYGTVTAPALKFALLALGNGHPDSTREHYLGHQLLLDGPALEELLAGAGFREIRSVAYDPTLDAPHAERHSVWREAVRA